MEESAPVGVHLVGSVPLGSAEEVFRTVADAIGDRLRRLPDGETGARSDWIVWQYPLFSSRPQFEIGPPGRLVLPRAAAAAAAHRRGRGRHGASTSSATRRRRSTPTDTFARLKRDGAIPPGCRFLVSLPTPLAPVSAFVALEDQAELEPVYEAQMRTEVERILAAIPADQLAIQWDARYEFAMLEGAIAVWFDDVQRRRRRAPAAARPAWCPRASSSASTSVTATTSTATSPSRPTPASSSTSPTRSPRRSTAR